MLAVLEGLFRRDLPGGFVAVLLAAGLTPTLLWRRSRSLLTVSIAFAATAIAPLFTGGVPPEGYSLVYLVLLPYALLRWGSGREVVLGLAVIVAKIIVSIVLRQMTPANALSGLAVTFAVVALGAAVRYRATGIVLAVAAIRRRDIATHRAWMIWAYALGQGAGTQALTQLPWIIAFGNPGVTARAFLMGGAWALNAAVAEWIIRRGRHGAPKAAVGGGRAARQAGYPPAGVPISRVAATPPRVAQSGGRR